MPLKILFIIFISFGLSSIVLANDPCKKANDYFNSGDFENAIKYYDLCISLNPDWEGGYLERGISYFFLREYYLAIEDLSIAININNDIFAYLFRGLTYGTVEKYNKSIEDLKHVLETDIIENEIYVDIKLKMLSYAGKSISHTGLGEYENAFYFANLSIKEEPNNFLPYQIRGRVNFETGNYKDAISDLNKSISLDSTQTNAHAFNLRGLAKESLRDFNGALRDYSKAIELDSTVAESYLCRGILKKQIFGLDYAIADFYKVINIEEPQPTAIKSHHAPIALAHMGKFKEAIKYSQELLDKYPLPFHYYTFAVVYSLMNRLDDAIKMLEKAFDNGFVNYSKMVNSNDLSNIKYTRQFKNLLSRYGINIKIPDPISDVAIFIPETNLYFGNRFALIIGNEDYSSYQRNLSQEVNVDYARNDAKTFKDYCIKVMGIPEKNINLLTNATAAHILQEVDRLSRISSVLNGEAEIVFYYAGHGLSDPHTKESYLIPVDVSGSNLEYAIKMQTIYDKLSLFPTKRTLVFLDACFSGGARNKELLAMRSIRVIPKMSALKGNMLVMASSSETESSQPYRKRQHGLFTYFLLKKLQITEGEISFSEWFDYVQKNVALQSVLNENQHQTPTLLISPDIQDSWQDWFLND